jgi:hypothetical protein
MINFSASEPNTPLVGEGRFEYALRAAELPPSSGAGFRTVKVTATPHWLTLCAPFARSGAAEPRLDGPRLTAVNAIIKHLMAQSVKLTMTLKPNNDQSS